MPPWPRSAAPVAAGSGPSQASSNSSNNSISTSISTSTSTSAAPPLSVFLTNLRLLDLDLLPDWPGISPQTFATGGAGVQGQKRRIHCVEWALFRLFALWDPEETAAKLKPLFPPLHQRQSLNLRAALLRALENAKKNGVLGRDSIIRKTMLDECKGERLEEVLACFSTVVLKETVVSDTECGTCYPAVASELALEDRGSKGINVELAALALAHRVSLRRFLERKEVVRARYGDFASLLSVKERRVWRRREVVSAMQAHGGAEIRCHDVQEQMCRTVRNNWPSDEKWMETLILGDSAGETSSGLLAMPFDRVWRRVHQGRLSELEEEDTGGLLEQLESRVRVQQERLERWCVFRREAFHHKAKTSPSMAKAPGEAGLKTKGIDLGFGVHQDLRVGSLVPRVTGFGIRDSPTTAVYGDFIDGLRDELARIRKSRPKSNGFLARHRIQPPQIDQNAAKYHGGHMEDEADEIFPTRSPAETTAATQRATRFIPARPQLPESRHSDTSSAETSVLHPEDTMVPKPLDHDMLVLEPPCREDLWEGSSPPSPSPDRSAVREQDSPPKTTLTVRQHAPSPTRDLTDPILEYLENKSLSSHKRSEPRQVPSLAQRTRLSMARVSNPSVEGDGPGPPQGPAASGFPISIPEVTDGCMPPAEEAVAEDLVSRTRRSMAGFERAKQKAQVERRRSQRPQVGAPPTRKDWSLVSRIEEEAAQDGSVLAEKLMKEEDMEAVFRSRPKIKASPVPSSTREWDDDAYK